MKYIDDGKPKCTNSLCFSLVHTEYIYQLASTMNQHCYHEYCWDYSHCSVILYCYENIVFTMIVITQQEIVNDCLSIKGKWLSIISFFNYVTEKESWSSHPMLMIIVKKSMRVSGKMERWLVMVKWGKTFEFT